MTKKITIFLHFHATMQGTLGLQSTDPISLAIDDGASLSQVYDALALYLQDKEPSSLWNPQSKRFRGPVIISSGDTVLKDGQCRLHDGQHIEIKRFIIGG